MLRPLLTALLAWTLLAATAAAKLTPISATPYAGAIVIEARTGQVLFEDRADAKVYPASVLKLMDLLLILEDVQAGRVRLTDPVTASAAASKMGGSQVYLKEGEVFPVEELLYALMIQSANDAALALAEHVGGSREAFVARMNERARQLGMTSTRFQSPHGLPPSTGQEPDVSTPRDFARLCRELLRHREALTYTSTKERSFRPQDPQPFIMRTHNHLLGAVAGCDGLKTGYFTAAGFSIALTAERSGQRVIAIVMGSADRKVRDAQARQLLERGFAILASNPANPAAPRRAP